MTRHLPIDISDHLLPRLHIIYLHESFPLWSHRHFLRQEHRQSCKQISPSTSTGASVSFVYDSGSHVCMPRRYVTKDFFFRALQNHSRYIVDLQLCSCSLCKDSPRHGNMLLCLVLGTRAARSRDQAWQGPGRNAWKKIYYLSIYHNSMAHSRHFLHLIC